MLNRKQPSVRLRGTEAPTPLVKTRSEWIAAAVCGGVATAPLVVGIIGWAQSWDAYTNLTWTLGAVVLWSTMIRAWWGVDKERKSLRDWSDTE